MPQLPIGTKVDENGDPIIPIGTKVDENGDPIAAIKKDDSSTLGQGVAGFIHQINPFSNIKSLIQTIATNPGNPMGAIVDAMTNASTDSGVNAIKDVQGMIHASSDQKSAYGMKAVQHAAGMLPIIGPIINEIGDTMSTSRQPHAVANAVGQGAGLLANLALMSGKKIPGIGKTAAEVVTYPVAKPLKALASKVAEMGLDRTPTMRRDIPGVGQEIVDSALLPTRGQSEAAMGRTEGQLQDAISNSPGTTPPADIAAQAKQYVMDRGAINSRGLTKGTDLTKLDKFEQSYLDNNPTDKTNLELLEQKRAEQGLAKYPKQDRAATIKELFHQGTANANRSALADNLAAANQPDALKLLGKEQNLLGIRRALDRKESLNPLGFIGSGGVGAALGTMAGGMAGGVEGAGLASLLYALKHSPAAMGATGIAMDRAASALPTATRGVKFLPRTDNNNDSLTALINRLRGQ